MRAADGQSPLASPAVVLGTAMAAAFVIAVLPTQWTNFARSRADDLLRPGRQAAVWLRRGGAEAMASARSHLQSASRLGELERDVEQLRAENRRLAGELTVARIAAAGSPAVDAHDRLLRAQGVPARVLGRQARTFLARQQLLDVGVQAGIEPDNLVVDRPAMIDRGTDAPLQSGQLVLSGGRIWGKVARVSARTSTVCTVSEAGYRDVVYLAGSEAASQHSPRSVEGILEGTGKSLARIRMIEANAPVSVGDLVLTASGKGLLPAPLCYGRVVRLERPVGAPHWEIWMEPAVAADEPEEVVVLRAELNRR